MNKGEIIRNRLASISKLRQKPHDEKSIKFLVKNSENEYKMILAEELVSFHPSSENVVIFFESLISNNIKMNYSKLENNHWITKISKEIEILNSSDIKNVVLLLSLIHI